jgi:transmembrane sensor
MKDAMNPAQDDRIPQRAIAEASVWVARINGANSEPAKRGLRRWLAESKTHRRAFDLASEVWDEAGSLRGCAVSHLIHSTSVARKSNFARAALAAAVTGVAIVAAAVMYSQRAGVSTGIGEQRLVTLEDGTKITLNTSTRLVVKYDRSARRVELERGEALFDVIKNPRRPFVVAVGSREVTALGTSFDVRRDGAQVSVTLLEGKVTVAPIAPTAAASTTGPSDIEVLRPGQRLTFAAGRAPLLDRPKIQKVTDWQRGRVSLDNTLLADAVAEMNRYSAVQLRIERPEAAAVRVSGVFRAGDSMSFARAVSQTYGLQPVEQSKSILLMGIPEKAEAMRAPVSIEPDTGSENPE